MLIDVILIYTLSSLSLQFFCPKFNSENYFCPPSPLPFDFSGNFRQINILFCLHFPLKYVADCDSKVLTAPWKIILHGAGLADAVRRRG